MKTDSNIGNVRIADDVVGVIARIAADEIEGIAGTSTSFTSGFKDMVIGKSTSKGIKAQINENDVTIEAHIRVRYGSNIPEIANKVQKNIKQSIENMTGLNVVAVNVLVQGISFNTDKENTEQ
jgi:uncharacterized alkaline shock family protein YloU